ncbi:MAG: DNA-binding protein [Pseudomonadota bacterium]
MPRTGISYDDVADAIHALEKAGLTPSIRLIREKIGRGSLSTVAELKRTFEAERASGPGPALPDPITKQLIAGAHGFWAELVEAAEVEITAAREKAQAEVESLAEQLAAAIEEVAELKDVLGARDNQIDALKKGAEAQAAAQAKLSEASQAKDVELARKQSELEAFKARKDELSKDLRSTKEAQTAADAERAALTERLEQHAAEFAKDKATLQKHFNEYKDRLVTMSDEGRQANQARRDAEKAAAAAEEKASASEREKQRLNRELVDARNEVRYLTDKLGEVRGELETLRQAHKDQLAVREAQVEASTNALEESQALVRQYVETDRSLVEELLRERRSGGAESSQSGEKSAN